MEKIKKYLFILLLTIKNVLLFLGSIALMTILGCLAFLPFMLLFHITTPGIIGIIALAFLAWVAWNVALDEYRDKHEPKKK